MNVTIIARDTKDSPNMTANDAAILADVSKELIALGASVNSFNGKIGSNTDAVCHMTRDKAILTELKRAEAKNIIVTNAPQAVEKCSRASFMDILQKAGIAQPPYTLIEKTNELDALQYPAWIKKADGWSRHKNDVVYANNANEAKHITKEMKKRGIDRVIHCVHTEGDLIKFYAVSDKLFYTCYPTPEKTKFGLEAFNGAPKHYPFDSKRMMEIANKAGKAIGVDIYGGDCIVDDKGNIYIIDINDFPSFSAIRKEAARVIANHIVTTLKKRKINENRG